MERGLKAPRKVIKNWTKRKLAENSTAANEVFNAFFQWFYIQQRKKQANKLCPGQMCINVLIPTAVIKGEW